MFIAQEVAVDQYRHEPVPWQERAYGTDQAGRCVVIADQNEFVVGGLTPGAALTWDAAVATETAVASSALRWGGPNDTTQDNAYGGFAYEIWTA